MQKHAIKTEKQACCALLQGFWPDGIYTAACDEGLKYDIEAAKAMGLNMLRKHIKIEPDRSKSPHSCILHMPILPSYIPYIVDPSPAFVHAMRDPASTFFDMKRITLSTVAVLTLYAAQVTDQCLVNCQVYIIN